MFRHKPALVLAAALATSLPAGGIFSRIGRQIAQAVPGVEYQFMLGDLNAERQVGEQVLQQHLDENKAKLSTDPALNAWVQGIFQRLVAAANQQNYLLRLQVIDDPTINAYALPGGGMFIYKGMLEFAESDDEVAAVLGHEIGHVILRHGMTRMRRDIGIRGAISALLKDETMQKFAGIAANFKQMSFGRQDEDASDAFGMDLSKKAGFDPSAAVTVWKRMHEKFGSKGGLDGYMSTHPEHLSRVNNTTKWLKDRGLPLNVTTYKGWNPAKAP